MSGERRRKRLILGPLKLESRLDCNVCLWKEKSRKAIHMIIKKGLPIRLSSVCAVPFDWSLSLPGSISLF